MFIQSSLGSRAASLSLISFFAKSSLLKVYRACYSLGVIMDKALGSWASLWARFPPGLSPETPASCSPPPPPPGLHLALSLQVPSSVCVCSPLRPAHTLSLGRPSHVPSPTLSISVDRGTSSFLVFFTGGGAFLVFVASLAWDQTMEKSGGACCLLWLVCSAPCKRWCFLHTAKSSSSRVFAGKPHTVTLSCDGGWLHVLILLQLWV